MFFLARDKAGGRNPSSEARGVDAKKSRGGGRKGRERHPLQKQEGGKKVSALRRRDNKGGPNFLGTGVEGDQSKKANDRGEN